MRILSFSFSPAVVAAAFGVVCRSFVVLDEAQNTTLSQIKMFLTRMGRNARFIVTGDLTQIDLARKADSGLSTVMKLLQGIDGIGMVEFDNRDIIRHRLTR